MSSLLKLISALTALNCRPVDTVLRVAYVKLISILTVIYSLTYHNMESC